MAIFKCKMCGGDLNITDADKIVECEYCGTTQTVPSADNEKKMTLFNRANRLRLKNEFDKAAALFEQLVSEFPEESEAYWGLCLCNYGIEYVDDPATGNKIPTCHRASFEKLSESENFELAMEYADVSAQNLYRRQAREIDKINEEILSISRNEKPYDVFICYKETDESGERTPDSVLAQEIYDALTSKGYKVFFSRISLEDKLGQQYEPYIFAALNSAKILLCVGTKYEYFHAVWVKNEWNRFLRLAAKDKSKKIIPCYKDMDPYDLPDEFKGLQAQDLGKLGAIQDLTRGVEKLLSNVAASVPSDTTPSVIPSNPASATTATLLKRTFMFLADGEWKRADEYAEKVLDIDPENGEAYLSKAMSNLNIRVRDKLNNAPGIERDANIQKALCYGSDSLKNEINGYIASTKAAEDKRIKAEEERRDAEEKRRKAEEELRKVEEERKKAEEKRIAEEAEATAHKEADKVISAIRSIDEIKSKQNSNRSVPLKQHLSEAKQKVFDLEKICAGYDEAFSQTEQLNAEKTDILNKLNALRSKRDSLGLFAGKEKKRLDEEISGLTEEINQIDLKLASAREQLGGFADKAAVDKAYEAAKSCFSSLQSRFKDEQSSHLGEYSYGEAVQILVSNPRVRQIVSSKLTNLYKGFMTITLGRYPQTAKNDISDIEWLILKIEENKALLISKYALDCQKYNGEKTVVIWETCSLRKWLNDDFINTAFSSDEQAMIQSTTFTADKKASYDTFSGNNTTDKVFLLSVTEVSKYFFDSNITRQCQVTEYCCVQGAYKAGNGNCNWWLRSDDSYSDKAGFVINDGSVNHNGRNVNIGDFAVRPAMWINL